MKMAKNIGKVKRRPARSSRGHERGSEGGAGYWGSGYWMLEADLFMKDTSRLETYLQALLDNPSR